MADDATGSESALHEEPGFRLRRLRPADHADLFAVTNDPDVVRYVGDGTVLPAEKVTLWIENSRRNYAAFGYGTFALADPADDRLFGWAGIIPPGRGPRPEPEIIYGFERARWGGGLGRRIALRVTALGFTRFGLAEIIATVDPGNAASRRILEGIGYRLVRVEEDEDGPVMYYRVRREEWV
ncbi:MAG TPA: GNAT family N-acetyltransferase [Azospirillaceae bacterium]|nr:GNAT family N-acetyltransferase [Azospirillaceae bacterium]